LILDFNHCFASGYSYLIIYTSANALSKQFYATTGGADKANPYHQLSIRSNYNIPSYVTMDTKLAFQPIKNVEFFFVGQNLLRQNHREYVSDFIYSTPSRIPRGIYIGGAVAFLTNG